MSMDTRWPAGTGFCEGVRKIFGVAGLTVSMVAADMLGANVESPAKLHAIACAPSANVAVTLTVPSEVNVGVPITATPSETTTPPVGKLPSAPTTEAVMFTGWPKKAVSGAEQVVVVKIAAQAGRATTTGSSPNRRKLKNR